VTFAELSETEIDSYLATGEPLDKAGAYGIQGFGAQFVTKVEGCYFNVMGFPIRLFYEMLKTILVEEEQ
jgi:septum formation protein